MGLIRILLAMSVVLGHVGLAGIMVDGRVAVQAFYMISGYLMALIVSSSKYGSNISFYTNRILRIYPVYAVVAAVSLVMWVVQGQKLIEFSNLSIGAKALLLISNVFIFGQDLVMFVSDSGGNLSFTKDFHLDQNPLYRFLLIPPAWSLSVELSFYLVAPFILRRRRVVFALIFVSVFLRIYLWFMGLRDDPWSYRFFPSELGTFLLGSASYMLLSNWRKTRVAQVCGVLATCISTVLVPILVTSQDFQSLLFCTLMFIAMPLALQFQSGNDIDKYIGDLSYPLYVCHVPVVSGVKFLAAKLGIGQFSSAILSILISITFAIILEKFVAQRVEKVRKDVRERGLSK